MDLPIWFPATVETTFTYPTQNTGRKRKTIAEIKMEKEKQKK
jgi:hypothetical protein